LRVAPSSLGSVYGQSTKNPAKLDPDWELGMKFSRMLIIFLVLAAAIAGCGKKEGEPTPEPARPTASESPLSPIPAPGAESPLDSPLAAVESPIQPKVMEHFKLDKPIKAGATEVSGRGPAGTPLQVVDITGGGEILGTGVIADDGSFIIKLGVPVEANRVIGISLSVAKDPNTWVDLWALRGEGARAIPQIGDFFDSDVSSP
jgi:hypothetical protein